jgi:hypothetical protein
MPRKRGKSKRGVEWYSSRGEDEKTLQTYLRLQLMPLIPPPWISLLCPPHGPAKWSGLTLWEIHSTLHLSSAQKFYPYTSLPPTFLLRPLSLARFPPSLHLLFCLFFLLGHNLHALGAMGL